MERARIGLKELQAIDGERGVVTVARIRESSQVLADAVTDFAFGDIFSRAELGRLPRGLATVAVLGAMGGAEPQLRIHAEAALNVGAEPEELVALAEHIAVYAGFPRALNLLRVVRETLEELGLPLPPQGRRLRLGDHETLVTDTGGDLPPLILLHALGLDRRMWRDVIPLLASRYRVIAYDLRGHGHAAGAPAVQGMAHFASDLADLMQALKLPQAAICGLSLGGVIAQHFTLDYPEKVASLGLVATTAWAQPAFEARAASAEADGMAAQIVPTLTRWFQPASLAVDGWAVRYARDRVVRNFVADWVASWRAMAGIGHESRLGEIAVPVRLVAGALDPSTPPELMQRLADLIPGATLSVIEGASHMVSLEQPRALAAALPG
jgi:3-oxoadipate enol-lactonase